MAWWLVFGVWCLVFWSVAFWCLLFRVWFSLFWSLLFGVRCSLFVVGSLVFVVCCLLVGVSCSLFVGCWLLFVVLCVDSCELFVDV